MAKWIHENDVEVVKVYKELNLMDTYLIKFNIPVEGNVFPREYEISISEFNMKEELNELAANKRERCYFSHGMTDIDFYKVDDKFALTHSMNSGINVQLILKDGELEKLIEILNHEESL